MTSRFPVTGVLVVASVFIQACGEENSIALSELPSPLPEVAADLDDAGYETEAMALGAEDTPVLIARDGEVTVAFARGGIQRAPFHLPTFPEIDTSTGCQPPLVTIMYSSSDRRSAEEIIDASGLC